MLRGDMLPDGFMSLRDVRRVGTSRVSRDDDDLGDLWFFGQGGGGLCLNTRRLPKVRGEWLKTSL